MSALEFSESLDRRKAQSVRDALTRAVGRNALTRADPSGPRVIVFDRVDDGIYARLAALGCEAGWVLAVSLSSRALTPRESWRLLDAGADDVFAWGSVDDPGAVAAARLERWTEVDRLVESPVVRKNLIGSSRSWLEVLKRVVEVARFTTAPVLLTGDSGTGKELVARLIHTLDNRADKRDLVVLDCTTIVPELSGSELFGHERGAFTNAVSSRDGAFALAHRGTLFLDELGELPLKLQAELLRVTQEKTYKRVGSHSWQRADLRLVCATHRDLRQEVEAGRFRRDFYHRLGVWTFRLPSLEERRTDIPRLVEHFLAEALEGGELPPLDPAVSEYLETRDYPGNVRELKQLVLRIGQRHLAGGPITVGELPEDERPPVESAGAVWRAKDLEPAVRRALAHGLTLKEISSVAADTAVDVALAGANGHLKSAARKLGITERALQMRRAARREKRV